MVSKDIDADHLRIAVEYKFPYPIARAVYQLRFFDSELEQTPQLANILGSILQYIACITLCDYLSVSEPNQHIDNQITQTLQKPLSHGTWAGLLRMLLSLRPFFDASDAVKNLQKAYENKDSPLKDLIDQLVSQRNHLIKKSTDAMPSLADVKSFKVGVLSLLRLIGWISEYPLLSIKATVLENGRKLYVCSNHMSFHDHPENTKIETELELKSGSTYLVQPQTKCLLDLTHFYKYSTCALSNCRLNHLFHFERIEKSAIIMTGGPAHHLKIEDMGSHLMAMLLKRIDKVKKAQSKSFLLDSVYVDERYSKGEIIANKYEIIEYFRTGGMATIYRAKQLGSSSPLALKILSPRFMAEKKVKLRFKLEALQLKELTHPNIVAVSDYGEDLIDHYICMEFASGWRSMDGTIAYDLGELHKPIDNRTALSVIRKLCDGLSYLHDKGIVHRDIKPTNILLFHEDEIKLSDFGIAKFNNDLSLTETGVAIGTPNYMSPEQAEGAEINFQSDVYSLGVLFYELITGRVPFKKQTPLATAVAHLKEKPIEPKQLNRLIPDELQKIILRCLEKKAAHRYGTMKELYLALSDFELSHYGPQSTSSEPQKPPNLRKVLSIEEFRSLQIQIMNLSTVTNNIERLKSYFSIFEVICRKLFAGKRATLSEMIEQLIADGLFAPSHAQDIKWLRDIRNALKFDPQHFDYTQLAYAEKLIRQILERTISKFASGSLDDSK